MVINDGRHGSQSVYHLVLSSTSWLYIKPFPCDHCTALAMLRCPPLSFKGLHAVHGTSADI